MMSKTVPVPGESIAQWGHKCYINGQWWCSRPFEKGGTRGLGREGWGGMTRKCRGYHGWRIKCT